LFTTTEILCPGDLVSKFKQLAAANSNNNIETCGFMFGKMLSSQSAQSYTLTHVFIPKQGGTADTCQPTEQGELEMYGFSGEHPELIQLGWIHTHPSQTAFLSSVDMATQFSCQTLLPEALAIVCSIKYNETKFLQLTEIGLQKVRQKLENSGSDQFTAYDVGRDQLQAECEYIKMTNESCTIVDRRFN